MISAKNSIIFYKIFRDMSNSGEKAPIRYGRALKNTRRWQDSINYIKSHNLPVEKWAEDAVEKGELCFMIGQICNNKNRQVKFHNRTYSSYRELTEEFRNRNESINYSGTVENKKVCQKMIQDYVDAGIIKIIPEKEAKFYTISPLNCLQTKENKFSLITHTLINSRYKKTKIDLLDVCLRGETLNEIDSFRTEDLHSAYHQYKLSPESMRESAFKFEKVTYCWQTIFYGTSGAVYSKRVIL